MSEINKYDICVLGLGYIGLPTASIFARQGLRVFGVDVRAEVVEVINQGGLHFHEPDLDVMVKEAVLSGNLRAGTTPQRASAFILAVPTPFSSGAKGGKIPDLSYVESATRSIAPYAEPGNLIVLESTSPVGTTEKVREWLIDERRRLVHAGKLVATSSGDDFYFAHCPERVLPGNMLRELVANDRIAGGLTPEAGKMAKALYQRFCTSEIFITDARTAEMAKLTENSSRDVNIAFANELSLICDKLGIDVWELIRLANRHPRVKILQPGPGVGGHCIAVDPWFIVHAAPDQARLIRTAREVNDGKPHHVVSRVLECAGRLKGPVVACLGLSFKADIDDLRESPAMEIVAALARNTAIELLAVEPHVRQLPSPLASLPNVHLVGAEAAVRRANIIVLLVNHRQFAAIDRGLLKDKIVIDTRGFWR